MVKNEYYSQQKAGAAVCFIIGFAVLLIVGLVLKNWTVAVCYTLIPGILGLSLLLPQVFDNWKDGAFNVMFWVLATQAIEWLDILNIFSQARHLFDSSLTYGRTINGAHFALWFTTMALGKIILGEFDFSKKDVLLEEYEEKLSHQ